MSSLKEPNMQSGSRRKKARQPKVLVWDIEATGLNATFGTVLCIGYKYAGQSRLRVPTILDGGKNTLDDRALVEEFGEAYEACDYHVTWYGDRYDLPMVQSKRIKYGLPPLSQKPSVDLWKAVRYRFKLHSNRLAVWQEFLGLEAEKTPIDFERWLRAAQGDKPSLNYVVKHCKADVLMLEEAYEKIKPWATEIPDHALFTGDREGCPACSSHNVKKQGFKVAKTRKYQQWQCMDCGRWWKSNKAAMIVQR
jgi:uncharacterized protein YprB with RNaseH-like and TPR domain